MAQKISHLPHIQNVESGREFYDPQHRAIFEVYFSLPALIESEFSAESLLLTEQVVSVAGLDVLQKTTPANIQKFFGVDVSFLNPVLDTTAADLTIVFNLNLRNVTDNFVLKLFKAWERLSYDLATGERNLMADYITDRLRISEANRNGVVWRSYIFHKVMLTGVTGLESLEYTSPDALQLTCTFRADWWEEDLG